jgi:hypothetical protein
MNFLEIFTSQIGEDKVDQMASSIGASKPQTMAALGQAVPLLVSAMARNTRSDDGANALAGALDRDHDGSILGNLGALIQNPAMAKGEGILGHVLGAKKDTAQQAVAQSSGLSLESTGKLFSMVAPMVMGMIGKKKKQEGFGASILATMLNGFSQAHESGQAGNSGGGGGGLMDAIGGMMGGGGGGNSSMLGTMITSILDRDGDGSIMDDVGGMIGGMMSGNK